MAHRHLARHPDPSKQGVSIDADKYRVVRYAIVSTLGAADDVEFGELTLRVRDHLGPRFEGSVPWYVTTVKLDLEARGVIERMPGRGRQRLRLVDA